jgi:hypothetical protein
VLTLKRINFYISASKNIGVGAGANNLPKVHTPTLSTQTVKPVLVVFIRLEFMIVEHILFG